MKVEDENREELEQALLRLEESILKRRQTYRQRRGSWFSYWLYERRVREEWKKQGLGEAVDEKETIRRFQEVIHQERINLDDAEGDEAAIQAAEAAICQAEGWLEKLER
ncbi:MAG: hypothetical protein J6B10_02690 [Lachnospiraceae bacterium]|nr:hypothetical protein [Lachnospiraceae bacterium]